MRSRRKCSECDDANQLTLKAADIGGWAVVRRLGGGLLGHDSRRRLLDWADIGIGAAGGFALAMISVGGALAISSHRRRRAADARPAATA